MFQLFVLSHFLLIELSVVVVHFLILFVPFLAILAVLELFLILLVFLALDEIQFFLCSSLCIFNLKLFLNGLNNILSNLFCPFLFLFG